MLAILAIALQCLVLQTHVHAATPADEAAFSAPHHGADDGLEPCSICRLGAAARVFTAPPAILIPIAPALLLAPLARTSDQSVRLTPAPAWRSRAPPISHR